MNFVEFPKIPRLSRDCTVTEKIDGTLGQVNIRMAGASPSLGAAPYPFEFGYDTQVLIGGYEAYVRAGSKSRWLTMDGVGDNHGFGNWVYQHAHELANLGAGAHFGEWWGPGINRGYDQGFKRWSLFNTSRWIEEPMQLDPTAVIVQPSPKHVYVPSCCNVVPVLYTGAFNTAAIEISLERLQCFGSRAAPGYKKPEGVVVFHEAAQTYFKKTILKDEEWKGKVST